jgi:hypothetical protein
MASLIKRFGGGDVPWNYHDCKPIYINANTFAALNHLTAKTLILGRFSRGGLHLLPLAHLLVSGHDVKK